MQNIDVKKAVHAARGYLTDMSPLIGLEVKDIRLEEVELTDQQDFWLITLGFNRKVEDPIIPNQYERDYKLFKVNALTGAVEAMKIRTV